MIKRILSISVLVALCGFCFSACVVVARPPVARVTISGPPVEYGYQPLLYDGYVVYYTDDGVPYYWAGGVRVWVPVSARLRYTDHYRHHRGAYRHWYTKRGHYYKSRRYRRHKRALKKEKRRKERKRPRLKKVEKNKPRLKKKDKPRLRPVD